MKTLINCLLIMLLLISCGSKYKVKQIGQSIVEITTDLPTGYNVGDTVSIHSEYYNLNYNYEIISILK